MKYLLWIGAGLLAVGIPFGVFYDPYDLWRSTIAGEIGGSLFLIALVVSFLKKNMPMYERSIIVMVFILLIAGFGLVTGKHYTVTSYQRSMLATIRTEIGSGMIRQDKIYSSMLPVLDSYYRQKGKKSSIVEVFRKMYGASITAGTFNRNLGTADYTPEFDIQTFVSYYGDSVIQYICIDSIAKGYDLNFKNASGHFGKLQYQSILTSNGVTYERVN